MAPPAADPGLYSGAFEWRDSLVDYNYHVVYTLDVADDGAFTLTREPRGDSGGQTTTSAGRWSGGNAEFEGSDYAEGSLVLSASEIILTVTEELSDHQSGLTQIKLDKK